MKFLSSIGTAALIVGLLSSPTLAGFVDFISDLPMSTSGSGAGNNIVWSDSMGGPVTVTSTAWEEDTINATDTFVASEILDIDNFGLGACNSEEQGACDNNGIPHAVDNGGSIFDYVLLDFSTPVTLDQLQIRGFGGVDADLKAWGFTSDPGLTTQTLANLDSLPMFEGLGGGLTGNLVNSTRTFNSFPNFTTPLHAILIAAHPNAGDSNTDRFKIRSVTFTQAVPIPDAALLFGTGLLGFIVLARRKNLLKKS